MVAANAWNHGCQVVGFYSGEEYASDAQIQVCYLGVSKAQTYCLDGSVRTVQHLCVCAPLIDNT